MIELSEKAITVLLSAKLEREGPRPSQNRFYFIERTLGFETWQSKGERGARADIRELYRLGLIEEFSDPFGPPCILTKAGEVEYKARTNG